MAQLLLKTTYSRTDVNVTDSHGRTPLMHAISSRMTYVSYKLLAWASVDLSVVDDEVRDRVAIRLACWDHNNAMVMMCVSTLRRASRSGSRTGWLRTC